VGPIALQPAPRLVARRFVFIMDLSCDVLVIGSGAAGFAAAVTAAADGLSVMMVEKANVFGGSTCYSAGLVWIPDSRQARAAGLQDSADAAYRYLDAEAGTQLDRENAQVYVHQAADILSWFEDNSHVAFSLVPAWPDYHQAFPGSVRGGRSLGPKPFDGRALGARFPELRPPIATTMILGGMMVGREDLPKFYSMTRSWSSAARVTTLVMRYVRDRLTGHARGTRLSNGNALIAMLARSAFDRGVTLRLNTAMTSLLTENGRVVGATVRSSAGDDTIRARGGVVLAGGGFPGSDTLRKQYFGHVAAGKNHRTITPAANSGDGLRAATAIGATVVEQQISPAAWTPMSLVPQPDGSTLPFPHFNDRGKAGYIAVDTRGKRFCSEALSYHDFVPKMVEACRTDDEVSCHVICDSHWIRRHGLGMAPPAPGRLGPHVASGYIKRGETIADLARQCGIDPAALQDTVTRFNAAAARGEDPEFNKGGDHYERFNGSLGHTPNPCLAPLLQAPFYAVKLVPGDIGTFVGLRADADARVLREDGVPIDGLYAAGNDAGSFMGGTYPGAGTSIGPAMVFGHLAARHIALALSQR
jgi:succinate dehydrogenase/fumarate reductase flavoprotein subunit